MRILPPALVVVAAANAGVPTIYVATTSCESGSFRAALVCDVIPCTFDGVTAEANGIIGEAITSRGAGGADGLFAEGSIAARPYIDRGRIVADGMIF